VALLQNEVLPTLQIRQVAMLELRSDGRMRPFFSQGLPDSQLPDDASVEQLLTRKNPADIDTDSLPWLKLWLPFLLDGKLIGLWLFGRRDPDDRYSEGVVRLLEVLSHQTSIALANISKTEQLQRLYDAGIQRQEEERIALARELHDDTLNDLAALGMYRSDPAQFMRIHERSIDRIRLIIRGLRPAMLEYGLWRGLADLVQDSQDRGRPEVEIVLRVPQSDARFPDVVEQHLYRIVQQAIENSLEHAQPTLISVDGFLHEGAIQLLIRDDGIGMPNPHQLDLRGMLENHHYGLVGVVERASLIHAELRITSEPGAYTSIEVTWTAAGMGLRDDQAKLE
jgi:signal transduction histidine kinase